MSKKNNSSINRRGITEESSYYKEFNRFSKKLREKIYKLRLEQNLTQEQMVEYELNLRQFQRIESGETQNITLSNLFRIAKALGIKVSELVDV